VLCRISAKGATGVVTTAHTPWTSLHPASRAAWRATVRLDDTTVAVSAAVAESLPARRDVIVLPHGVDPARIAAAIHDACGVNHPDGVVAVTVASHRDVKNYPNLLRAVRVARDAGACLHLVAVGEGPALEEHRRLAEALSIGDVVTFEPPSDDVLARIAAADLLVVASDYEGQPMVVMEALALGKPVVATAVGRVPELVTPDVGRVVPPQDADALGRALAEVAGDEQLRNSMGKNATARPTRPTLDDVLDAHIELYTRAAAMGSGTTAAH
jgi:glycosyltransferase involved in cell wall biosynthesis